MPKVRGVLLRAPIVLITVLALLLGAEAVSLAAKQQGWTKHDLAYYLSAEAINFIRPGLVVKITGVQIATDGKVTLRFKLTDPKGLPLDRDGVFTPGGVSTSFMLAYIPKGEKVYTAYTTRLQVSPITNNSAVQASADSGGTYTKIADGEYTYAFRSVVPANYDRTVTHTAGMWSTRNLTEFDLGSQRDDDFFSFVPDGSAVTVVRDVMRTETCNKCHLELGFHGGSRKSVELCILCHQPQSVDPDTGNSVDMTEMVHKIHMGKRLPSVVAGKPYQIIGHNQTVADYSAVGFPDAPNQCTACHDGKGAQSENFATAPSRQACGSCHDDVNFASGEKHLNLPQVSDNLCANCHLPQGELEYDASIKGAHTVARLSRNLPGTVFEILKVDDAAAGRKPTVTFTLLDKSGRPILPSEMGFLYLVLAGPTTDYTLSTYLIEDARQAQGTSGGTYSWTLSTPIPADAKGTYAIGITGFRNVKLLAGTMQEQTVRDNGANKVVYFSVDGSRVEPRRTVVSMEKCNSCHGSLLGHSRFKPADRIEACLLCHIPSFTDKDATFRTPAAGLAQPLAFGVMIHKVHTGKELTQEYTTYGQTSLHRFNGIGYPGDRRHCEQCHVAGSQQLPLRENLQPSVNPRGYINPTPPETAACLACHDRKPAAAHASINISATLGEACSVCHGPSADQSVDRVHAR